MFNRVKNILRKKYFCDNNLRKLLDDESLVSSYALADVMLPISMGDVGEEAGNLVS